MRSGRAAHEQRGHGVHGDRARAHRAQLDAERGDVRRVLLEGRDLGREELDDVRR